ncbi:MAG: maleylpyruvate isomerase family mycothiol-dependent enzyme [Acidimicrobiia bacterium]
MHTEQYRVGQQRVASLVVGKDPDRIVPACPAWTASDVVRHLAGVTADVAALRFECFGSDGWTETHVASRRHLTVDEVIAEWEASIDDAVAVLDSIETLDLPERIPSVVGLISPSVLPAMALSDLVHHEFDIRNAYGDTTGRDIVEVHANAAGHARTLRRVFPLYGLPTLRIESTDGGDTWDIGRDEPVATVRATSFELMRGIGGRRTRAEMLAWPWTGDGEKFVDAMVLPHLGMPSTSLGE